MHTLYGKAVQIATRMAAHENETGVDPTEVARAVEHALLSSRPRTRYPVGRQAKLLIPLSRMLPDRLKDELLLRATGLPRTADATARSSAPRSRAVAHA